MKKYFNFKDKRAITLTLIAIITLLSLIIGATYAYFIASENLLTTSRTLEVTTNNTTSVVATGNTTLTMDLNLDDMRKFGTTKTYYATREGKTETETEEDFINIQSTSSTKVYCTYTAELTKNDTENYSNMIDQIIANGKEDEMVLTFLYNGVVKNTFDMKTAVWDENNKIRFTGILSDIDPNGSAVLDAKLYLKNLANVDQAPYLAQSALNLQMKLTNVNCDTMDTPIIESLALSEINYGSLEVTMNEGAYELASYCVDQVERSTGECENWIPNNDKVFTAMLDLSEPGTYYLHVKDIRGYIADSAGFDIDVDNTIRTVDYPYNTNKVPYEFTLTAGLYKLEVWGGQGGKGGSSYSYEGGKGGYSVGTMQLIETTKIFVRTGGQGETNSSSSSYRTIYGGYNGGGSVLSYGYCGAGGGATDIRLKEDSLYSRIIVAGGGSGSGWTVAGSYGGGTSGGSNSSSSYAGSTTSGGGAYNSGGSYQAVTAGTFGIGGNGSGSSAGGSSGGGGWYGGGGAGYTGGSGGGSGYVYTEKTASQYPSGCLLNSINYLIDAQTIGGNISFKSPSGTNETGHAGNGHARITTLRSIKVSLY